MIDDLEKRQQLLAGDNIVGELGEQYFAELQAQIDLDVDPLPRVVLTGELADGTTIRVVEGVTYTEPRKVGAYQLAVEDQPIQRGFIWWAMVGNVDLFPTMYVGRKVIPCRIFGARLEMSTRSAQDALDRARHTIDRPVTS